jgi:hypothetical protein
MIGMMLAAALASTAPTERPALQPGTLRELDPDCRMRVTPVDRQERAARATRLGDLPKAHLMLPVERTVRGCAVPTFVRYDVEGDGRFATPAR